MITLLEQYTYIYDTLKRLNDELWSVHQTLAKACQLHSNNIREANTILQDRLIENSNCTMKINAFIGIAKTHTTKLNLSLRTISYDNRTLSRLAVQINSGKADDPFATQLYTEATGQLKYLSQEYSRIQQEHKDNLKILESSFLEHKRDLENSICKTEFNIKTYLLSKEFTDFIFLLEEDQLVFGNTQNTGSLSKNFHGSISLGVLKLPLPVPRNLSDFLVSVTKGLYDASTCTIRIPANISLSTGSLIIVEYENTTESIVLSGIQNFILNIARYYGDKYKQVNFIDPIRFNSSSLGCLSKLCGKHGSFINSVPTSIDDLRNKIKSILADVTIDDMWHNNLETEQSSKNFYVFHNFPQSYDATLIAQIQQLCVNVQHYGITVVLTNNKSSPNFSATNIMAFLLNMAVTISSNSFVNTTRNVNAPFEWYTAPPRLPADIVKKYINEKPIVDKSNDYQKRIGLQTLNYCKGTRALKNIPFGVDQSGVLKTLDFEDSNFATFICGASRSGKSTLLHTLITGFIQNNHPDDIEIWLIDFKMTEFSRYINHLPPHVRYIILDESPELVYDILDRLTDIMHKRQQIFKGKWQKLEDIPVDKYMPAILVIIDEFSVMSQIVADSVLAGKENYANKFQLLLAKGAALGLHFILSSQGFTSGTRGLNDFSKKQIQQRIAMKTEYSEIKETLDLKSPSEADKLLMEQLPVFNTITRIPVDAKGNHVCLTEVLYISDYSAQEKMIDAINTTLTPVQQYDAHSSASYINKKAMIIDGNIYTAFNAKQDEIESYIDSQYDTLSDGSEFVVFIGEPRRMISIYPIHIANGFCENILIVAPPVENIPACSVILSLIKSLNYQGQNIEIWSSKKNPIYRQLKYDYNNQYVKITDLNTICQQIKQIKLAIQNNQENNCFFILTGFESVLIEMSFQISSQSRYEKRAEGEPDLNTLLASSSSEKTVTSQISSPLLPNLNVVANNNSVYDAREDLKYILTNGPRLGYHFIIQFGSPGDVNQSKIDLSLFKHKIMFRTAKNEATFIIGATNSTVVANLEDHSFRYSNGLDSLSFRPYLHLGISWDGWQISDGEVINVINEEEEYLL